MNHDQKLIGDTLRNLPQPPGKVQLMHVYVDGTLRNFRTKDRTWPSKEVKVDDLELLEFCGSATDFDVGDLADYYAKPIKFYNDPFRGGNNKLVFCETYSREGLPTFANNRYRLGAAKNSLEHRIQNYTFQQSYTITRKNGKLLSYNNSAYDSDSKADFCCGREIDQAFYKACLYAGVNLTSSECVDSLGKWQFTIGPLSEVDMCDDVWMSRFLLTRVAEDFGVVANFETSKTNGVTPNSSALLLKTDTVIPDERLRIQDALLCQFILKETKHLKIQSRQHNILISDLNADIDPYSIVTKVLEALNSPS
ncbi:hypothetical protein JTE90_025437 [Oedothorax gibbosus]|uniref:Glutamine synthetase n=1 Tax=Oedothorax gibbosus TaxID=931172 RepID=A0AAV6U744_9ARAC|nr:hypothetical protein JTE90_025437 [Oedothorax gibbosus]